MSKARELADLGSVTTRLDQVGNTDGALSNRNMIINGEFLVWQRSENAYNGGGQSYLSADRFTSTRGRIRKPNTNGNTGEDNRGAVFDTTDGSVYAHFDYAVEDVGQKLHGKTMTFSFYAKILSGGATLLLQDAGGDHLDFGNDRYITLTSNWERYTVTGTIVSTGSSFGIAMPRLYLNPAGGADPRMIQVDQFQLEEGDTVTPFEHRSYSDELARCQRFYEDLTFNGGAMNAYGSTPMSYGYLDFKVAKRATPTMFYYTGFPNHGCHRHTGAENSGTFQTNAGATVHGVSFNYQRGSGVWPSDADCVHCYCHMAADAEL